MKQRLFTIIMCLICSSPLLAQNVGIGTSTPNASAQLDISSTSKGMLVPRMTSAQRTIIASPAKGLLVFDTDNNSFWFYNGTAWNNLSGSGSSEFISQSGTVHNTTNSAADNFVFGSPALNDTTGTADNNRFFFNKAKAAFRAGHMTSTNWNNDSTGNYSFASGTETKAKGEFSTAMGEGSNASGHSSTALGAITTASGWVSTALGGETKAPGSYSTASGYRSNASGDYSTAIGNTTTASGNTATAIGSSTTASGGSAAAMGSLTTASGNSSLATGVFSTASGNASTAMGIASSASGDYSIAIGAGITAPSYSETTVGSYNTNYTTGASGATQWNNTDRLFTIGNGTADDARKNALTILKNGNTGIGTDNPTSKLDVNGQVIIEQKNFGGYGGLLIKGNVPGSNYPNIGFSVKNSSNADVIAASVTGELMANATGAEAIDLVLATSQTGQSGLSEKLRVKANGALAVSGNTGSAGQVLTSNGNGSAPSWKPNNKPYAIAFAPSNGGSLHLSGSSLSGPISGLDGSQFTLAQQATVIFTTCLNIYTLGLGAPNSTTTISIKNSSNAIVGECTILFKPQGDMDAYTVTSQGIATGLAPGTYTISVSAQRENTLDGELLIAGLAGGKNRIVLQILPE